MASLRSRVTARAGGCCEYCRSPEQFAVQAFSVEHVEPRSLGGSDDENNLALACQGCNNHKYNRFSGLDPATGREAELFNLRRDAWADHFIWSDDWCEVVGLTPVGRATVVALRLNRSGVVNLRRVLFAAGFHPPAVPPV